MESMYLKNRPWQMWIMYCSETFNEGYPKDGNFEYKKKNNI